MQSVTACLLKNRRTVKGDDVDAAHLLGNHDGERSQSSTSHTRDGEKLYKTGQVGALANDCGFFDQLSMNVVKVTSGLEWRIPKPAERLESFGIFPLT